MDPIAKKSRASDALRRPTGGKRDGRALTASGNDHECIGTRLPGRMLPREPARVKELAGGVLFGTSTAEPKRRDDG
jgi:hypothetical protein